MQTVNGVNRHSRRVCLAALVAGCIASVGVAHAAPQVETVASGFAIATALGVDADGNVFVGEGDQSGGNSVARVRKFSPSGTQLLEFGSPGSAAGQLNLPYALAFDASGNIYVAENYGNRLQKFNAAGNYVATLATPGTSYGCADLRLFQASGVAVSGSSVFVSSQGDSCVQKISTSGVFQTKWGSPGVGPGLFNGPSAVAVDSSGNVYVADAEAVQKFDSNGTFLLTLSGSNGGYGMTIDRGDNVYIVRDGDDCRKIEKRSTAGTLIASECSSRFIGLGGANTKLASDAAGRLYISSGASVVRVDMTEPAATLTGPTAPFLTGTTVQFDASGSNVPFGSIARYEWDVNGDGSFERDGGTLPTLSASFASAGARTVAVRVTAPSGKTATASVSSESRLAPPTGEVGVSINDAEEYTNNPEVNLWPVWPAGATEMRISNDGGFRNAETGVLGEKVAWTLRSSGDERLPKTVYVRFSGSGIDTTKTYQDDIILDQTPPQIVSATAVSSGAKSNARAEMAKKPTPKSVSVRVRLKATDALSGVGTIQVSDNKRKPGLERVYATSASLKTKRKAVFIRAQDRAGNWSAWRTVHVKAKR